jgi:hypothetical protein
MIKKLFVVALLCLSSCSNYRDGQMLQSTATSVVLQSNNYKTVRAGATGVSHGFSLLGFLPIVSPNYAAAKANLYQDLGTKVEGKSIALANQTEDRSSLWLILFSIPKIMITADVIEFTNDKKEDEVALTQTASINQASLASAGTVETTQADKKKSE